jgi:hypothetical protein
MQRRPTRALLRPLRRPLQLNPPECPLPGCRLRLNGRLLRSLLAWPCPRITRNSRTLQVTEREVVFRDNPLAIAQVCV